MENGRRALRGIVLGMLLIGMSVHARAAELVVFVQLEKKTISSCEPVDMTVLVENRGSKAVALPAVLANPHHWVRVKVVDPRGRELEYRGPEIQLVGIGDSVRLYPGNLFGTNLRLDCESYDLSAPGEYAISVIFGIGPTRRRDLEWALESNEQVLRVTVP